uniref:Hemicentin-1-like isoform X2 n=1 Tax=Crassostrea virginica TaxID=6565 RepID=A0A8B8A532_CRAVI|nr:hemicentin-1-like isoform X2 [Crassostrea virginica]
MLLGLDQLIYYACLFVLCTVRNTAGITLTVIPSNDVAENQTVTLQCELDPNPIPPIIVSFSVKSSTLCQLEPSNGVCRNTTDSCRIIYNAFCPSETRYSIQVNVTRAWSGASVVCRTVYEQSNKVVFSVKVPVTSVTLTPRPITLIAGQQMNLTCTTSSSYPSATVTWYKASSDITNQSISTIQDDLGLLRTISSLRSRVVKEDNGKQVLCRASNTPGKTVSSIIQILNVMYKPEVRSSSSSLYRVREGQTATLDCEVNDANPNTSIIWRWIKMDSSNTVLHNGPNYTISNIQRGRSGSYNCTASNTVGTSEAATITVDVLYAPSIEEGEVIVVNENERILLRREISSNPLANVSWYDGPRLLKSEIAVSTTTFMIEKTRCTDTKNFTLTASNALLMNVTSFAELRVNCRPIPDVRNHTIWVDEDIIFSFSTKIIAYPEPRYALLFENGLQPNGFRYSMTRNTVNNFTLYFYKTTVQQTDYGTYNLHINNTFGETTVYVNVLPQRKPNAPVIDKVSCKVRNAQIQWASSYNGGAIQTFIALATIGQQTVSRSEFSCDKGESKIHSTHLQNLQPSTKYAFYIVAQNKHGNSSSKKRECKTLDDETNNQIPVVAGSTLGSLGLVALILVSMIVLHKRYRCIIKWENRARGKESPKTEKETHYTTIAEQENNERSLYDELTQNRDQYESVLMKDREGDDVKMYEQLQKNENVDKQLPVDAKKNDNKATGSTTPLHEQPSQGTASEYSEYTNTSFTE